MQKIAPMSTKTKTWLFILIVLFWVEEKTGFKGKVTLIMDEDENVCVYIIR